MTRAWSPTGLIPWFSKLREILMLLYCITLSSSRENQRSAQEVARRIFGAVAWEIYAKLRHTKYPSQLLILRITLFAVCHSFSSPPLHPCRFIHPLFPFPFSFFNLSLLLLRLFACVLDCLLITWLKIILNCVTLPIPTIMILLALRLLLLPMLNLVKLMLLC